jgi:NMD protein affecting ribosome stability and mRNA decay
MKCPDCQRRASEIKGGQGIAAGLPDDITVLVCRNCRAASIVGADKWIDLGPGLFDTLLLLAEKVKGHKIATARIKEDDWDDPAWTTVEIDGRVF